MLSQTLGLHTRSERGEGTMAKNISACSGKVLKKLLIGFGVFLALILLSGYLFVHFYFYKTFSHELSGVVIRCSGGIQAKSPGGEWLPMKVGQRLVDGTRIAMPEAAQSFMSFEGLRLLSDDATEVKITGSRGFTLVRGNVAVAAANKPKPLRISLGAASLTTTDSVVRVSGADGSFSVECISGTASLRPEKESEHLLAAGQKATISPKAVQVAAATVQDPFALLKVSVLDRIRERFDRVVSKYARRLPADAAINRLGRLGIHRGGNWADAGLRFASYVEGDLLNLAQADSGRSIAEYYETLFVPSNRSISIGRQKVVLLEPGRSAAFPTWSHDGSMIAYIEYEPPWWPAVVKVVRLDDLEYPWVISQEYESVRPMFPLAWSPDNRHVLFQVQTGDAWDEKGEPTGNFKIVIAPIDPAEGPLRDFDSPFYDIPLRLPLPVGKTISPQILKLPWGDALLCANWGNVAYIPIEQDGQSVATAPGLFLTNFDPRELFVAGGVWSPSGSKIMFMAVENLDVNPVNVYILYDVEDILDGFTQPPRSLDDPRVRKLAPSQNAQFSGGFSFDESLAFFEEDVNNAWRSETPTDYFGTDFDLFYANASPDEADAYTQIHMPGTQKFFSLSPEGSRVAYCNDEFRDGQSYTELRVVSFDVEADMDMDLGGVLIDNSGTNLIVPPGTLQENFKVKISTPFTIGEEAEIVWVLISFAINIFFVYPMMARMMGEQGSPEPQMIMNVVGGIVSVLISLVYPVVLLIMLNLKSIKEQFETAPAQQW